MYEAFFNLKNKPFSLLPDPEFLFLSSRHAIGLSLLEYSLTGQAGFCVITGEIGSGKTTLVRAFLERVTRDFTVGLISNTHQALKDIAAWALASFGQKATGTHPAETYQELMAYLIAEYGAGRQCILIVDEAQNLSIEVLEELRLLSNINSGKDLLLQVVLVGQPELLDKLKRPELSQFAQRIAISHHLTPLPYAETRRYIEHRVKIAGSDRPLFTEMAMGAIQYFSGGIPRLINSICDMSLVYGFADEQQVIGEELVFRVVSDRQLSGIAPFAQSVPVDDPSVRAEIMKLANLVAPTSETPAPAVEKTPEPALEKTSAPAVESRERVEANPRAVEPIATVDITPQAPELLQRVVVEAIKAAPLNAPGVAREAPPASREAPPAPREVTPTIREVAAPPVPREVVPTIREAPLAPREAVPTIREVEAPPAPREAVPTIREVEVPLAPREAVPTIREVEAPLAKSSRANPYFFRDQEEEDEELLLTIEMNDSSLNAHRLVPAAQRATSTVSSHGSNEPYLGPTRNSDTASADAVYAPNQARAAEEIPDPVVDPMPWPSINERRLGAPIPAKEHGTGTPPRRSWWRRSIGHNS
jgi:general secretion pathway protein A